MKQTATSCAADKHTGRWREGRDIRQETFTRVRSVLRSEVRSGAHLGQPGQQRSRGFRYLISPHAGSVPGDKRAGTSNRAQNPGVARDWERQSKKGSSSK